ncbi:hypothetical protein HYDPIDRAFT_110910 [Hydnomerulius pinastri MD-312]|uniref:Uncharacterized protein n=1 Tax=Hydnomerulius pinastri MD-312 TaxID=994086 RepID=A0A0C9W225_9AGAM|nr:hypothetical protein HYDPIDRAFT_110910 [Hydnomerulius pinastri MD-312]
MTWGVFYRPPDPSESDSDWDDGPGSVHDGYSPNFIREYPSYNPAPVPSGYPNQHTRQFGMIPPPQFSRHAQSPPSTLRKQTVPQFKTPLSISVLNDPAFSTDPRSHPHFPLTNAGSYKAPPSKSPASYPRRLTQQPPLIPPESYEAPPQEMEIPRATDVPFQVSHHPLGEKYPPSPSSVSVSLESDSLTILSAFTSPTVSSATSHNHPSVLTPAGRPPAPVALFPPPNPYPSPSPPPPVKDEPKPPSPPRQQPGRPAMPHNVSAPEMRPKVDRQPPPVRAESAPVVPVKKRTSGKGRMRNLVRRLTSRHNLDRIDELDETDPFGGGFHHGGPYEAIGSNLAELGPAHMYNDIDVLRGELYNSKRETNRPTRPVKEKSSSRVPPPAEVEDGMTLHLEPGQILRRNTTYEVPTYSAAISMTPSPNLFRRKAAPSITRPDHARSQSLPNHPTHPHEDLSRQDPQGYPPNSLQSHSSPSAPRVHYFGDNIPHIPNSSPSHIDRDSAPYAPPIHRQPATVLPPNHYQSTSRSPSPPSLTLAPPPPPNLMPQQTQPMDRPVIDLPTQGPRHKSVRSLDSSRTFNSTNTQSSSGTQNRPLLPPRTHHLPKRLVMPAPLQPQPPPTQPPPAPAPPPQFIFPPTQSYDAYDEYPDHLELEDARYEGPPTMYQQGRRLLRKKSSAFPANTPLPAHAPMSQGEAVPTMGSFPSKLANEAERTKEGTRRRRLSKRKNDN